MDSRGAVTSLSIAALLFAAGPALAQSSADKPSTTQKIEEKTEKAGDAIKSTTQDMKTEVTDSWITAKTKIALFADERVKGRQVNVVTKDGVVMLRGKVDDSVAKTAAADVAKGIDGVKSVKDELQVVAPAKRDQVASDDKIIAKNVETKLGKDTELKRTKVDVNNGVVSLTGEVKSIYSSARASELARSVAGVRSVKNDLTYASRSSMNK